MMTLCLRVSVLVSARERVLSPEHDEDSVSLLQGTTLAIQVCLVLHRDGAICSILSQRVTPDSDTFS